MLPLTPSIPCCNCREAQAQNSIWNSLCPMTCICKAEYQVPQHAKTNFMMLQDLNNTRWDVTEDFLPLREFNKHSYCLLSIFTSVKACTPFRTGMVFSYRCFHSFKVVFYWAVGIIPNQEIHKSNSLINICVFNRKITGSLGSVVMLQTEGIGKSVRGSPWNQSSFN